MHLYSGELDKIVGEREAKATKWGGGATKIGLWRRDDNRDFRDNRDYRVRGEVVSRKAQRVNNKNATTKYSNPTTPQHNRATLR